MHPEQQLGIKPSLRTDITPTYWHRQIGKLLRYNAADLTGHILREAERNPCLEVEFTGHAQEFSVEMLADRRVDFRQELKLQLVGCKNVPLHDTVRTLIDLLDNHGYLREDISNLAKSYKRPPGQFIRALVLLQRMEPAGIGARSMRECYILQLKRTGRRGSDVWALVNEAFEPLSRQDVKAVLQHLEWEPDRFINALEEMRGLTVHPVTEGDGKVITIIPDAEIIETGHGLEVRLLEHSLPMVGISGSYLQSKAQRAGGKFVNEGLFYAKRFLYCLERRNQTLLDVLTISVQRQENFLRGGERKPLKLKDVAKQLDLCPSTLTHAVANKYVRMDGRIFPVRTLFVNDGVQGVSKEQLKKILRERIDAEDSKAPLSDQALADALGEDGLLISRRTVAQYRHEMRIEPAVRRKKK